MIDMKWIRNDPEKVKEILQIPGIAHPFSKSYGCSSSKK